MNISINGKSYLILTSIYVFIVPNSSANKCLVILVVNTKIITLPSLQDTSYLSEPPAVLDVRRISIHASSIIVKTFFINNFINNVIRLKTVIYNLRGRLCASCRFITILTIVYHTLHCYNLFIKAILFYMDRDYFTCCSQISQYVTRYSIKSFCSLNYCSFIIDNNILHVAKSL